MIIIMMIDAAFGTDVVIAAMIGVSAISLWVYQTDHV